MMNIQQTKRQVDTRKLLTVLRAAKSRQDETAQPCRGRGLWLSSKQWHALIKHLERQVSEVEVLEQAINEKEQEANQLRQQLETERLERAQTVDELHAQVVQLREQAEYPLAELGALRTQMRSKQETWDNQKYELETQLDRLMGMLRKMGLLADSEGHRLASAPSPTDAQDPMAIGGGLLAPDVQALQLREMSMLLADARHQAETYRRQLAMRSIPAEEMAIEIKRLKADNQRLVALLAKVPEYRAMAEEVAAESGVHYIPIEECLMIRGQVDQLYPQLVDRPVEQVAGQDLAGAGRWRDPDALDPALTLVLDEQYHWVPRKALEAGMALMRRMLPALPVSQLLVLVMELNKVWRDRERNRLAEVAAAHRQELQRLQHIYQQRAPYEAVVAGQKINDLKRRMRAQAAQAAAAAAAAKAEQRRADDDNKVMLHAGLSSIQDLSRQVARLVARNKKLAGKAARQRALSSQPLCAACFDRLLLSDTLGEQWTGAQDLHNKQGHQKQQKQLQPRQQQDPLDPGADDARRPCEPGFNAATTAAAPTEPPEAPLLEGPYDNAATFASAPSPRSSSGANQYNTYGGCNGSGTASRVPDARQGLDIPTLNLTGRIASGAAASTEPYNSGAVVGVYTVPPPPPAAASAARAYEDAASARHMASYTAAAVATRSADQGTGIAIGNRPAAMPEAYQGPGITFHAGTSGSGTTDAIAVGTTANEPSAASLADWRTGAVAPIMVQVQAGGASPARTVLLCGGAAQAGDQSGSAGVSIASHAQVQVQPRGVPVRVRLRFPRQDVIGTQHAQQ